ncbi:hypothetical protein L1887_25384 [Cichorium endivia]|nr:hypothetical protein L1887_25384 [Cichorium endivia]
MALQATTTFSIHNLVKTNASFKDSSLFGVSLSDHRQVDFSSAASTTRSKEFRRKVLRTQAVATTTQAPAVNRAAPEGKKTLRKGSVIITGASSGLGLATAKALAETGKWHVIMACRDFLKAERAAKPLDVLVCNAAVYQPTAKEPSFTADGIELSVGTNHLGHFLLSRLLLDDMKQSDYPSKRLIIVGSITGNTNTLAGNVPPKANLGDMRGLAGGLNGLNSSTMIDGGEFDGAKAYKDSKICNMLTMQEFHRDSMKKPASHLRRYIPAALPPPDCSGNTFLFSGCCFLHSRSTSRKGLSPRKNPASDLHSDPSLTKSGVYWSWNKDSASFENQLSEEASDVSKARKVWEISEKLVGLA